MDQHLVLSELKKISRDIRVLTITVVCSIGLAIGFFGTLLLDRLI